MFWVFFSLDLPTGNARTQWLNVNILIALLCSVRGCDCSTQYRIEFSFSEIIFFFTWLQVNWLSNCLIGVRHIEKWNAMNPMYSCPNDSSPPMTFNWPHWQFDCVRGGRPLSKEKSFWLPFANWSKSERFWRNSWILPMDGFRGVEEYLNRRTINAAIYIHINGITLNTIVNCLDSLLPPQTRDLHFLQILFNFLIFRFLSYEFPRVYIIW